MTETTNDGYWVKGGLYKYLGLGKWEYVPGEVKDQTIEDICSNTLNDNSAKADAGKPRLSLVPRKIIWAIARIREYGNKKYGDPNNWKRVEAERYRDAAYRHFMRYLDDPTGVDEESGLPHLWHLATNISFLCELEKIDELQGDKRSI